MKAFVMFGQSGLFGDYADLVHSLGGVLRKVVVNVPDPVHPGRPSFAERLELYEQYLCARHIDAKPEIQPLAEFAPQAGETYLIGFRGLPVLPLRDRLVAEFGIDFDPLVHPTAVVSPTAVLEEGAIVGAGAVVAANVRIGRHALVNRGASIGHESQLAECTNVGPGVNLASNVRLGRGAVVGIGATVIEDLQIGAEAYVAAGAVVIRDVPPGKLVAGVPAAVKKDRGRAEP